MRARWFLLFGLTVVGCGESPAAAGGGGAGASSQDASSDAPNDAPAVDAAPDADQRPLTLMTWNLQTYPLSATTADKVAALIGEQRPDIVAVQEISSAAAFRALPDLLPAGYQAVVGNESSPLVLGFLFQSARVSLGAPEQLFPGDSWAFPRPPFKVKVIANGVGDGSFDFVLINVHLKAQLDAESAARRKAACVALDQWIEGHQTASGETDFVVMGDFNDELTDPPAYNVFEPFLNDPANYAFVTLDAAKAGEHTYLPFQSMIDHVLLSSDALVEYGSGKTDVLELEQKISAYEASVSDHRPVLVEFGAP